MSVLIPVFNAERTIAALIERLVEAFRDRYSLQVVLVNDGSSDDTHWICVQLVDKLPHIVSYIRLAKNFGEHNAVMAGLRYTMGKHVVIMDDDLQHRPEDAIRLVDEAKAKDLDIVYSSYARREHGWFRIVGSRFHGFVANLMLDKPRDLYLSSFKCLSRWVVTEMVKYTGPFPYVDGLALRCTRNIGRVEVAHQPRGVGHSGYNVWKLVALWSNMLMNFSVLPLRASLVLGFVLLLGGMLLGVWVAVEKLAGNPLPRGWAFLVIVTLLFTGTQLVMLGVVGEYVGRLFLSMNATPQFVVKDVLGVCPEREWDNRG